MVVSWKQLEMLKIQIYDPKEKLKFQLLFLDSKAFSSLALSPLTPYVLKEKKSVHFSTYKVFKKHEYV